MKHARRLAPLSALLIQLLAGCQSSPPSPAEPQESQADVALKGLGVQGAIALHPEFSPEITDYVTDSVSFALASVSIHPLRNSSWQNVTCDGIYDCSSQFPISDTGTVITVRVTNSDMYGTAERTYRVKVLRKRWRPVAGDFGIPWSASVGYGKVTDPRDGQDYRTVTIGNQTWMAQNLNYVVYGSYAYMDSEDSAAKYGRLYTWVAAMGMNEDSIVPNPPPRGLCFEGWHIPTSAEWDSLERQASRLSPDRPLYTLKATAGWNPGREGTDALGFRLLPAGNGNPRFQFVGERASMVSRSKYMPSQPVIHEAADGSQYLGAGSGYIWNWYSVRCVRD